jgi:rod shape-determining protein MreD
MWQRLDSGARLSIPLLTVLVCMLLGAVAWPLPYFGTVAPPLVLMAIYYWTVHRPDLFGPGLAFMIGLINDVINYLPLGVSAFLFVGAHQLILNQRRFFAGHSFFMLWFGFVLTIMAVMASEWLLLCVVHWQLIPALPILAQNILAIVIFPLPCWAFIWLQRLIPTGN